MFQESLTPAVWGGLGAVPAAVLAIIMLATISAPTLAAKSVLDGVFTAAQANRGVDVYVKHCLPCHGPSLQGGLAFVPALDGISFTANWRNRPLSDLLDFVIEYMPLNNPGVLDAQAAADAMAYVLMFNGYFAGDTEMTAETARQIRFVSLPREQ